MKSRLLGLLALNIFLIPFILTGQGTEDWHNLSYLSNLNYWHSRIPIIVENVSKADVSGEPARMKIGIGPGELSLDGVDAAGIRVVDTRGNELLWRLTSQGERLVTEGPVPDAGEFLLPVTVRAGTRETYYIYFNNPSAWSTGATLPDHKDLIRQGFKLPEESLAKDVLKVEILKTQSMTLREEGRNEEWPEEAKWNIRVPIKVMNFTNRKIEGLPVYVNMDQVFQRLHDRVDPQSALKLGNGSGYPFFRFMDAIVMDAKISEQSELSVYAYFANGDKKKSVTPQKEYVRWLNDSRNLVKNADLIQGEKQWNRLLTDKAPKDSKQEISNKGNSGGPCFQVQMPVVKEPCEVGWSQSISIMPGHTYMFCGMAQCTDALTDVAIKVRIKDFNGTWLKKQAGSSRISGNTSWTYLSGIFTAPESAATAELILSLSEAGTVSYKGIIMMEVVEGRASSMYFDQREKSEAEGLYAWQVNPIVKVFHEDLPPGQIAPVRITVARNESEPLQLALRSPHGLNNMRIEVTPPEDAAGQRLDDVEVTIVGYVPIDYPSNYYGTSVPYWFLKYPSGPIGSDGWAGFWPDPLLPLKTFDLPANVTQPVWIEVTVPDKAESSDYIGMIKLFRHDSLVKEIPWTIHVWNFALPQKNTFGATYDVRDAEDIPDSGLEQFRNEMKGNELRDSYWSFMAKHRMNAGEISPVPAFTHVDGKTIIDFTEYDKAASYYFEELKNPFAYLPTRLFYLFGWAFPPSEKFGEKPYRGEYPYENADRGDLRQEYKLAYQKVLKAFWDHITEKGWADRYILYLSDEPHMAENSKADIVAQMKALCNMIHEVNQDIPIYVSTWNYRPEWEGYIDVWGVAYNGGETGYLVPAEDYEQMKRSGDRIWYTTDGNFCTETPYMALERLLPYFGYKYGAEAYEFWGVNWLTYNPYKFGWHSYIFESQAPGESSWKRYPNGDGYVIYPGKPIGQEGLVASIRLKQVREGAEDYEYLSLLGKLIEQAKSQGQSVKTAEIALQRALALVNVPCAMGRYSTKILSNPDEVYIVRELMAESIEFLSNNRSH